MENKFKEGDCVLLKTTNRKMVINKVNNDGTCECFWNDGGTDNYVTYKDVLLEKIEDTGAGGKSKF